MQKKIDSFLLDLKQIQEKFKASLLKYSEAISELKTKNSREVKNLIDTFNDEHKVILEKLDYLNAEIFRYGELLKKEFKVVDLSGVMKDRFSELKNAVEDYVQLKSTDHEAVHQSKLDGIQSDYKSKDIELKQKRDLLEEEFQDRIEKVIEQLEHFKNEHVNTNKNTCPPELLHQFNEASFDETVDELTIGQMKMELTEIPRKKQIQFPQLIHFKDKLNLVVYYDKHTSDKAESISDVLLLRMLLAHLPDKLKLHIYDKNMNEKFREFLSVPDSVLTRGFDWNQFTQHLNQCESEIRSKLGLVWSDITSDHQTLHQYNVKLMKEEKYDDIVSYFLFVFDDFLSFMNPHESINALQRLDQLLNYGCNAILLVKTDDDFHKDKIPSLQKSLQSLRFTTIDLTGQIDPAHAISENLLIENLGVEQKKNIIDNFLNSFINIQSTRSKLKFTAYLVDKKDQWFKSIAAAEVRVPIGKSQQSAGYEYLSFKTKDMLSNALLCGGVGSGKTNFLKSVISSIALNYSPKDIEMWLIDMKNGAGFSVFHNSKLPHATRYAFSAESELINDVFYQLKREMEERYAYFAQFSVDNLEDASKLSDVDPSKLKRIILIIDEFATIFNDDEPFLEEIAANLLSIIQKGRAMGINMLLAAQNFNNIRSSAFAQAVTLIPTRILLKSSPEAAQSVLGSSNHGSVEITRIGEGLINTNYGELNSGGGNHFFKSFLIDNEDLKPLLDSVREEIEERKIAKPEIKFIDASQAATFSNNFGLFSKLMEENYKAKFIKNGLDCYMGETYLMSSDAHFSFPWKMNGRQFSQNILIAGNERDQVIQSVYSTLSSLSYGVPEASFKVNFLNALDPDFSVDLGLNLISNKFTNYDLEVYDETHLETILLQLDHVLMERRNSSERSPIITYLIGFEKLVKLQKQDYLEPEITTKFKALLSTGSSYGLYFVLEINKPSNLDKVSRDLLGFIEHRICFTINPDESNYLINNKAASKLIDLDAPTIRNKAIYYSLSEGNIAKFKSYSGLEHDASFCRELNKKVKSIVEFKDFTNVDDDQESRNLSTNNDSKLSDYSSDEQDILNQHFAD